MKKPIDCKNLYPPKATVKRWHCEVGDWYEGDCPIFRKTGGCAERWRENMKNKTFKVYCLKWTGTQLISPEGGNYTSKERADKHCEKCNDALPFWRRFFAHKWVVSTLTIKE